MASNTVRKIFATAPQVPKPIFAYSVGVLVDKTLYLSGQVGVNPNSGSLVPGGAAAETKQAMENIGNALRAAGADFKNVVKTTVLLADINDIEAVNEIYKQYFTANNYPARTCYQVGALPFGVKVEIETIAITGNITDTK